MFLGQDLLCPWANHHQGQVLPAEDFPVAVAAVAAVEAGRN